MSRTTTALKRLGVPAVAAITLFAGIPAFVATSANAAPGDTITMTPDADSASAGTCNPFTVTVRNQAGQPATSTVDVVITERNNGAATANDTFQVRFCTANTTEPNASPNQGSQVISETPNQAGVAPNNNTDTTRGEFTPDADGTFTFGVVGTEPGVADILAFIDNDNDNALDAGEARETSVKTFTAGTRADVRTLDAEPETQTNFIGETVEIFATLRNAAGDTVAGVTPDADITSGPNAGNTVQCDPSNNDGVSRCFFVGTAVGTDTISIFVNQTNADNNPSTPDTTGADAGEPQDTVTNTTQANPTGLVVDITCGDANTPRTSAEDCINPLTDGQELFTATVTQADGPDAGTERDRAAGVIVNFTVGGNAADANDTETVSPTTGTTDSTGRVTTTLTDSKPSEGEVITVTATVRGQDPQQAGTADSGTKTFRTADDSEARNINITSGDSTATTSGQFREITAVVTNVNGERVPGVEVTFSETGAGAFRNGSSSVVSVTDANGVARADVTSGANETGTQTITATITEQSTQCGAAAGTPTGASAGNCSDSTTNTFGPATASPSPSATPTAGTTSPSPSGPPAVPCTVPASITLDRTTIIATGSAQITVRATPNSVVQVFAYSRPSTTYRVVRNIEIGGDGVATDRIVPPTNTRLYAQQVNCNASPTIVLNVRTSISLAVVRNGVRTYTFSGQAIPARPNGLIVSLYRVTNDGRQILTAQTRANANAGQPGFDPSRKAGSYTIRRVFTGTGRFGFVVRTGQDLQNAPGSSNVRSLLVF